MKLEAVTGLLRARSVVEEVVPVPDSATVSGLPGALLLTDRVPVAGPAAVGLNDTLTVQEAPADSDVPQLFDSPNGPVTPIDDIDTALVFGFVTVTDCAGLVEPTTVLPNETLDGDADSALAPLLPVPVSATVSGLLGALEATDRVPLAAPAAVGANFTLTVQEPPAAMEVPQVLVWLNGPLAVTDDTDTALVLGLDTVTVCAALLSPHKRPKLIQIVRELPKSHYCKIQRSKVRLAAAERYRGGE